MLTLKHDKAGSREAGTWRGVRIGDEKQHNANVCCPGCGNYYGMAAHKIADDGTVSPSVVCDYAGCAFHDFIKLDGWSEWWAGASAQ